MDIFVTRNEAVSNARPSEKSEQSLWLGRDRQGKTAVQKMWGKPANNCDEGSIRKKNKEI
jgi:hypothetical protein